MGNTPCSENWRFAGGTESRNPAAQASSLEGPAFITGPGPAETDSFLLIRAGPGGPHVLELERAVIAAALASFYSNIHLQSSSKSSI